MNDNNTVFQKKICITSAEKAEDNLEHQSIYNNATECGAFIKFEDLKSFSLVVVSSAYYKWFIAVILRMLASDRKWDRTREELTANKTSQDKTKRAIGRVDMSILIVVTHKKR